MLWATMEQYRKQGLQSESRVVDINHVDVRLFFRLIFFCFGHVMLGPISSYIARPPTYLNLLYR